jgi:endoglucanase
LFVDTGGIAVPAGTPGVFTRLTVTGEINAGGSVISAKALDNRASCAVLLDVLRRLDAETLNVDLSLLFSTQEEVGLRGAQVGALNSGADYAVVVDVTFGKSADTKGHEAFELGKGPTIGVGPNMNRKFTERLKAVADKHNIPYQIEVLPGSSGTNSAVIQLAGQGIATALVSVTLRYMHTPVETLDVRDLQYTSDLLYWLAAEWEQN